MDTVTGNKLIAEFDAFDWDNFFVDEYGEFPSKIKGTELDLEYHTSWDWLMPVVEKIGKSDEVFHWELDPNIFCIAAEKTFESIGNSIIDNVWETVVNYIQWLNQHPTNP